MPPASDIVYFTLWAGLLGVMSWVATLVELLRQLYCVALGRK